MAQPNITAVTVVVEVDGQVCLAPINADAALAFVGMLPAFQGTKTSGAATLYRLPPHLAAHAADFGKHLSAHVNRLKQGQPT